MDGVGSGVTLVTQYTAIEDSEARFDDHRAVSKQTLRVQRDGSSPVCHLATLPPPSGCRK